MTDIEDTPMFCFQCEQTAHGEGCTKVGICTKDPSVAALQDAIVAIVSALSIHAHALAADSAVNNTVHSLAAKAIFATLTNVSFEPVALESLIRSVAAERDTLAAKTSQKEGLKLPTAAFYKPAATRDGIVAEANAFRIDSRFKILGKDRVCLQELLIYGIKGLSAYAYHAAEFGVDISEVMIFVYRALSFIHTETDPSVGDLLALCLESGAVNIKAMELLDTANTGRLGHQEPTAVKWVKLPPGEGAVAKAPRAGKCIVVSGHDLLALEALLEQIEKSGGGIDVYTHGEMLPANGYPGLKKHKALAGHYGTAWQNQKREFAAFPGPVLMTTNCYIPAPESYLDRVFSLSPVGGVNVRLVSGDPFEGTLDFTELIKAAREQGGFVATDDNLPTTTVGFGHKTVIGAAGTVLGAVTAGELRRIVLIGGCDGFTKERNYFTELAERLPQDVLILTLACGKFKINHKDYGTLGSTGLPRLMDMGQCNNSLDAIKVAVALADALKTDVNSLPLTLVLSWFEQKAVSVLLSLLHLGIKNIYVGPRAPAFFTPTILGVLVDKFNLHLTSDPEKDMQDILS